MTILAALLFAFAAFGQPPKRYECRHTTGAIRVDGRLNESDWKTAPWSEDFVDIEWIRPAAPTLPYPDENAVG